MMKRKLAFLTAAIIGLSSVPIATLSTDTITYVSAAKSNIETFGDFEYTPYTTYAEINKYTGSDTIVELPSEINGLKVTRIADSALCNCKTLEKLIIPEGVTRIGEHALSQNNNLQEIQFPSTLESIGFAALGNNKSLIEIHLPEGLKIIDNDVFNTCYAIKDIYIPSSVESIGSLAPICYDLQNFHVDENNKNYCDVDGVLYSKDKTILVRYPENRSDETYIIPETVIEIANSAFETDRNIVEIDVPDTVIKIGERCFSMCSSLKSVRLPDGLTEIPDYCFGASEKIEKIYIPKSITNIGFTAFQYTGYSADKPFKICYEGTQNDWNNITIGKNNSDLEKAEFVYSYSFDSDESIKGDVNADGNFTVADVVMLQKWLLAVPDVTLPNWKAADLCEDGTLNVFDLCMMKRELLSNVETKETALLHIHTTYGGHGVDGQDLGSGEFDNTIIVSEGDTLIENHMGHWYIKNDETDSSYEDILEIKSINSDSIVVSGSTFPESYGKKEITLKYNEALDLYSTFTVYDGINFNHTITFDKIDNNTSKKKTMTMNDVFELSKKGKNLTWSDFENYQHGEDIGSGLAVYEFKVANCSDRFTLVVGYSDENSLQYVRLKSSGSTIDITESSENDIMMFIAEHNPPA